ncbi:MAG TPA: redox-sensing transcriptional repressor Rex [Thermoanaerobaculia bacterium]|nr:redox-sensing transcriptional repressor Rex [Thermoanaerobaculia bacterium]
MDGKRRREPVSEATTHRLSLLLRCLRALEREEVGTVSSQEMARRFGLNSAQIRKDLAQFGEFGVRGVGYRVVDLKERLKHVLGVDRVRTLVIVGAGNLGQALADSRNFNCDGFRVAALFDVDGRKIGSRSRTGVPIRDAAEIASAVRELGAEIGILAVPAEGVASAASALAAGGLKAILNFAPAAAPSFPGVLVKNLDLTLFLESLAFQIGEAAP